MSSSKTPLHFDEPSQLPRHFVELVKTSSAPPGACQNFVGTWMSSVGTACQDKAFTDSPLQEYAPAEDGERLVFTRRGAIARMLTG